MAGELGQELGLGLEVLEKEEEEVDSLCVYEIVLPELFPVREERPGYMCMVDAQSDILCGEARDIMHALARKDKSETPGREDGFAAGTLKCILAIGMRHGVLDDFRRR